MVNFSISIIILDLQLIYRIMKTARWQFIESRSWWSVGVASANDYILFSWLLLLNRTNEFMVTYWLLWCQNY